jgi:hypothetical protein
MRIKSERVKSLKKKILESHVEITRSSGSSNEVGSLRGNIKLAPTSQVKKKEDKKVSPVKKSSNFHSTSNKKAVATEKKGKS